MENNALRTLAPATRPRSPPIPQPEPVPKRKRTSVACDLCRERRTGCDGVRPVCAACRKRNTPCMYVNDENLEMRPTVLKRENIVLREKIAAFQGIINRLGALPPHSVQDILQRLKSGSDPVTLLKTIQGHQLDVVPSAHDATLALLPPLQSNTEFELLIRHPNAFPALDLSKQAQNFGNTFAGPSTPMWSQSSSSSASSRAVSADPGLPKSSGIQPTFSFPNTSDNRAPEKSEGPAKHSYFDARLSFLEVSFWTTVPITNGQAAQAISCYLEVQHHIWGVFDAGLFVRDLIGFGFQFCSPFMVSALLAVSCAVYRPLDLEASNQSHAFEKEAEKLFQSETELDSLPTVAGLALLYMSMSTHGEGVKALRYLTTASDTAERLKLYGVSEKLEGVELLSPEQRVARSATAWGMFNLIVFLTRLYLVPPVSSPPQLSLPGMCNGDNAPVKSSALQSDVEDDALVELDRVLAYISKFWLVMNQVFLVYRDSANPAGSLAFALSKYSKILRLADELPKSLRRERSSTNHALIFHMHLHLGIMDIFRPFLAPDDQHSTRSFLPISASPRTIYGASVRQIKGLIFEYTFQFQPASFNLVYPGAIIYAVNAVLNDKHDPDQRNYFFFYIEAGLRLRSLASAPTVTSTFMAMLAIAYDKGVISNAEAIWWKERFNSDDDFFIKNKRILSVSVKSGWAVDMHGAATNVEASSADALANRFQDITLFDELTEGVV